MARKSDRKALGRGLSALLGDAAMTAPVADEARPPRSEPGTVPIDRIRANPHQPRKGFDEAELRDLAASLSEHGVIQPIVVRPDPRNPGDYQIVAGERRWRAAQLAGLHEVPAIVRELDDREVLELGLIENVQRVDLDAVEEAQGYTQLVERFGYTQDELARVIGKSRSHLANTMRLLSLPAQVLDLVRAGKLSAGHARALITAPEPIKLAEQVVLRGLSVRQVEELARKLPGAAARRRQRAAPQKDADTRALEGDLSAAIGMRVLIEHQAAGGGEMRIRYKDLDALDRLCRKLAE